MKFSLSIVSHGSGSLLAPLLCDLGKFLPPDSEIILTFNIVEDEQFLTCYRDLPIRIVRNQAPMGFGANHNQAFAVSSGCFFVVMNPDIRLLDSPFEALSQEFLNPSVGVVAPQVVSGEGRQEDSVRRFPTFFRLARRVLALERKADYAPSSCGSPEFVDWAAGMFLSFSRETFSSVKGFDTRYFMYMEDADICRRMLASGRRVLFLPRCRVVHNAQRASRRSGRHLWWHIRSAARFLSGIR